MERERGERGKETEKVTDFEREKICNII